MEIPQDRVQAFQDKILTWYSVHMRDLPWRKTRDPYRILVSEVMLQQTQVNRVIPKYEAWLNAFPTIKALASASKADVLRLWSGLGYNRRALFLQKTAQAIMQEHRGVWPPTIEGLKQLPGIGEYTSRAIACFAFDQQVAVVDTNVKKVILVEVLKETKEPNGTKETKEKSSTFGTSVSFVPYGSSLAERDFLHIAEQLLPDGRAYDWNQALMDYASTVLKKDKIPLKKQSQFVGSNRYYRGKVLKYLLAHVQASEEDIAALLSDISTHSTNSESSSILFSLEKEGFIVRDGKYLRLSE